MNKISECFKSIFNFGKDNSKDSGSENNQKYMLPIGFYDLLGREAEINHNSINILLKEFSQAKYQLIKTPLVEFEENWQENKELSDSSFKMIDALSNKTLVIRSDITTQIARLVNTKLKDAKLPLRLSYVGDVLKVKNEDLHADRQLTQAGIELIGDDSDLANKEVINIILAGLKNIGLSNLLIDFCLPKFLPNLFEELGIENAKLQEAIAWKNISQIRKLGGEYAEILANLALPTSDIEKLISQLTSLPISKDSKAELQNLEEAIALVKDNYPNFEISIDIFGDSDFSYHEGLAFSIFDISSSCTIARGGSYFIGQTPAIGASVYINNLRKILSSQ